MASARFIILSIFLAIAAVAAPVPTAAKDKWINITSKHFNIVSNAGEGDARRLASKLEQFHYVFSTLFGINATESVPVTVVGFDSDSSFTPFKPQFEGKPKSVGGYFVRGDDESVIALKFSGGQAPLGLVLHEYTHLLTSFNPRDWPIWLKEGIAEVYSTFDIAGKEVTVGRPVDRHVLLLRQRKFIPIGELFKIGHDSPYYNERDKQGLFYAQSWALAHYLMFANDGTRRPELTEFIKRINAGAAVDQAFSASFKTDAVTMEKELWRYITNDRYPGVIYQLPSTEGDKNLSVATLSEPEALAYQGNLLLRTRRLDEAEGYFKRALSADPNVTRAFEGLGFVALRRSQRAEAKEFFRQAVERKSKNHLAHAYYADALLREAGRSLTPELVKTITESLKTSTSLMPAYPHAHYLLGYLSLVTGDNLSEGAQQLMKAQNLAPQRKQYALTLARLQVRLQDYAGARKTLGPLLADDSEPSIKSEAESIRKMIEN